MLFVSFQLGMLLWTLTLVVPSFAKDCSEAEMSTVKDGFTGLVWGHAACQRFFNFQSAQLYCQQINDGGLTWRLPSMEEMRTSFQSGETAGKNFRLREIFKLHCCRYLWSSTKREAINQNSWLKFLYGKKDVWTFNPKSGNGFFSTERGSLGMGVLCVADDPLAPVRKE